MSQLVLLLCGYLDEDDANIAALCLCPVYDIVDPVEDKETMR